MTLPPPGWYPDAQGRQAYWDGQAWQPGQPEATATGQLPPTPPWDPSRGQPVATSGRAGRIALIIGVVLLVGGGLAAGLVFWLSGSGPESVVKKFEQAQSCDEVDTLVIDDAATDLGLDGDGSSCAGFDDFFDNYDFTFDILRSYENGNSARVVVKEVGKARPGRDVEDFDTETTYRLRKVEGDWKISDIIYADTDTDAEGD